MISVVIPTMWRYDPFYTYLSDLIRCAAIDEILIIDNDHPRCITEKLPSNITDPKVRLMIQDHNLLCNPSWNLGVRESRNEKLCLLNDDAIIDIRSFYRVDELLDNPTTGIIGFCSGVHPEKTHQPPPTDGALDIRPWNGEHTFGFATIMFFQRKHWDPVPDDIPQFYGDNWAFEGQQLNGRTNYWICNSLSAVQFATTCKEFVNQEPSDMEAFRRRSFERILSRRV